MCRGGERRPNTWPSVINLAGNRSVSPSRQRQGMSLRRPDRAAVPQVRSATRHRIAPEAQARSSRVHAADHRPRALRRPPVWPPSQAAGGLMGGIGLERAVGLGRLLVRAQPGQALERAGRSGELAGARVCWWASRRPSAGDGGRSALGPRRRGRGGREKSFAAVPRSACQANHSACSKRRAGPKLAPRSARARTGRIRCWRADARGWQRLERSSRLRGGAELPSRSARSSNVLHRWGWNEGRGRVRFLRTTRGEPREEAGVLARYNTVNRELISKILERAGTR